MKSQRRPLSRRKVITILGVVGLGVFGSTAVSRQSRQELLADIDPIAREHGQYTAYQLSSREFIGVISRDQQGQLDELEYKSHPLSAAKFHPETEAVDDYSLRRIDPENLRWQWHVHLWIDREEIEMFSHYEYRPDIRLIDGETTAEMRQRLRDHYNPKWDSNHDDDDANYFLGETCDRLAQLVNSG